MDRIAEGPRYDESWMAKNTKDEIARARAGDRDALNRLLLRVQEDVTLRALGRVGDGLRARVRVSDLLQSTYLEVVRGIAEFDGGTDEAFAAWVGRILENNIRDKRRFHTAKKRDQRREYGTSSNVQGPDCTNPAELAATLDELDFVQEAMARLPENYREVLQRRYLDNEAYDKLAEDLGRTASGVRVLAARARASLLMEIDRLREPRGEIS